MCSPSGSTTYGVLILNHDIGAQLAGGATLAGGDQVVEAMKGVTYADSKPLLKVSRVTDRAEADARLRNRDAAALVVIPADFSRAILATREGREPITTSVTMVGDLTNPYYACGCSSAHI
jgi:hypothetical protein